MKLIVDNYNVWNPMEKAAEIVLELERNGYVELDLQGEAPDVTQTDLSTLIDYLASKGLDTSKIKIINTGNPLETFPKSSVNYDAFYEIELLQEFLTRIPTHKDIKFHFGNFVSKTNLPRLLLASHLYTNYREKTFQTFHYAPGSHYHKNHLYLDKLVYEFGATSTEFDEAALLLKNAPILKEEIESYPILIVKENIQHLLNPCQWYPQIFVDVICETWYTGNSFYVTEKFWRAVATKTPFIIQGTQHVLSNLKKIGFKTFHDFWDEGYDEDPSYYNISEIKKTIKFLSSKSIDELKVMYNNMQDILDHNYNVFINMNKFDIQKVLK